MLRQPLDSPQAGNICQGWRTEGGDEASGSSRTGTLHHHGRPHHHHPHHPTINNASDALLSAVCGGPFPFSPRKPTPPNDRNSLICFLIKQVLDLQPVGCVCCVLCVCHCYLLSFNFAFKRFAPSASKGCAAKGSRGQDTESWFRSCCQKCVRSSLHFTPLHSTFGRPCVVIFHFAHNPAHQSHSRNLYMSKSPTFLSENRAWAGGWRRRSWTGGESQAASSGSGN